MKYAIIPYIALGLALSLAIGIEYHCEGQEMFPKFYGSPFVFKQESLASSMQYFYSISGLILNVIIWSGGLFMVDLAVNRLFKRLELNKLVYTSYRVFVVVLIVISTFLIAGESVMLGNGFDEHSNYWFWNMEQEAKAWEMTCRGELVIFQY